jgi:hypothetical protein
MGYALLLLSLTCFTLFVINSVVLSVPREIWLLFLSAGLFLLSVPPALLFTASPRLVGGPVGLWFRLYTRSLARRAPTAPISWSRYTGLYHLLAGVIVSVLIAGLEFITLYSGQSLSATAAAAYVAWIGGCLLLLIAGTVVLSLAIQRRMREEQEER